MSIAGEASLFEEMNSRTIVGVLAKNAVRFPEKTAIIYKESKISYAELNEISNALASFLASIGLEKGERVGLVLKKTPEAIISFLGVAAAGGPAAVRTDRGAAAFWAQVEGEPRGAGGDAAGSADRLRERRRDQVRQA